MLCVILIMKRFGLKVSEAFSQGQRNLVVLGKSVGNINIQWELNPRRPLNDEVFHGYTDRGVSKFRSVSKTQ